MKSHEIDYKIIGDDIQLVEVELDQNGVLLHALRTYADWTGDLSIVELHWEKENWNQSTG